MKKFLSLFLGILLLIPFIGCRTSKEVQGTSEVGSASSLITKHMQRTADEIASIPGASVSIVTDIKGYTGIQVIFEEGILFDTGKSTLKTHAKNTLTRLATLLKNDPNTNVQIFGHTDSSGSRKMNEKLSLERANVVKTHLHNAGIPNDRLKAKGLAYDYPVANNRNADGRALNRRVEVYITANKRMIKQAKDGTLK